MEHFINRKAREDRKENQKALACFALFAVNDLR